MVSSLISSVLALSLAASATAHMSIYTPSMYGVGWKAYGQYEDFQTMPDAGDPFAPLGPGWEQNDWWFRGPAVRALKPKPGAVSLLPAGGSITFEIACHVAWTSFGGSTTVPGSPLDACPGNSGAYHSGDPNILSLDLNLLSGCALGIADVDDISKVTIDNLAIFSTQKDCVKQKFTSFDVPARMPACTGSKCICGWFWLANNGTGNFYMTAFDCAVTGSPKDATPIMKPVDPDWCDPLALAAGTCKIKKGAKRPLYSYNTPSNIVWRGNWDRPGYHPNWGFYPGAQNDIFELAAVPSSSSTGQAPSSTASSASRAASSASSVASSASSVASSASSAASSASRPASTVASSASSIASSASSTVSSISSTVSSATSASATSSTASSASASASSSAPSSTASSAAASSSAATTSSAPAIEWSMVPTASSSSAVAQASSTPEYSADLNLARAATATASSEDAADEQTASKAIDGVLGSASQQWATSDGQATGWIKLTWPSPVNFNRIKLFDSPVQQNRIVAGIFTAADGSTFRLPSVRNFANGVTVDIPALTTTSLTFTITTSAATARYVGLSEFQVFNIDPSLQAKSLAPISISAPAQAIGSPKTSRSLSERLVALTRSLGAKQRHARDFASIGDDFGADQVMVKESIETRCSGLDRGCELSSNKLFEGEEQ